MDRTAPVHAHPRRRNRFAALLALALLSGSLGAGALSLAYFTDTQAVTGNAFATGTINISTTPATALFGISNMMPGDTTTQSLLVQNAGTGSLRYAMATSVVTGPALAGQLELTVRTLGTSCAAFDGTTVVATGALSAAAIGSNAQGPQAGTARLPAAPARRSASGLPSHLHQRHVPEHRDERHLHVRRGADRQQPVRASRATRGPRSASCRSRAFAHLPPPSDRPARPPRSRMTALRRTRRLLDALLLAAALTVTVTARITLLAPVLGGRPLVIGGGSMEPAIDRGALVLSLPAGAEGYGLGDVVTVQQGGRPPTRTASSGWRSWTAFPTSRRRATRTRSRTRRSSPSPPSSAGSRSACRSSATCRWPSGRRWAWRAPGLCAMVLIRI